MKTAIIFFSILFCSLSIHAYTLSSSPSLDVNGTINQNISIQCQKEEKQFCQQICQNNSICTSPEPLCLDCAGSSSQLLRSIFTRLNIYFEVVPQEINQNLVAQFLSTPNYILLSTKSIYNFYKPFDSPELRAEFSSFCPGASQLPLLAVVLNEQSEPTDLVYTFCQYTNSQKKVSTKVFAIVPKNQTKELIKLFNN